MLWSRKKKPDDAASEATADTASDSPVENDSEGSETPPEITAPEVMDQQGSESEPAASKDERIGRIQVPIHRQRTPAMVVKVHPKGMSRPHYRPIHRQRTPAMVVKVHPKGMSRPHYRPTRWQR